MLIGLCCRRCRMAVVFILVLSLILPAAAMAEHLKDDAHSGVDDYPFSILILGDSQMAGAGWEGGYANCILENYPNAKVLNLAQNGSLLAKGDIHAQWEYFLSEGWDMPDLILLDGGVNDLPYIQREEFKDTGLTLVQQSLRSLLELIHEADPDIRIIYTLMPPLEEWRESKEGPPSYDIQERYWKQINIIASSYDHVTVLDLFSLNPFRFPCAACYRAYFADSIHLNEAGYRKSFEYIDNILVAYLGKQLAE